MSLSDTYFENEFAEHAQVLARTHEACMADIEKMRAVWAGCIRRGGKILFFGNGGSASDAQHLATELTIRYQKSRAPIAAIALTTDSSALTACGNDLGFVAIFARQLDAIGKVGDVAVGITTSGKSANVIRALEVAQDKGIVPTALTGCGGGDLGKLPEVKVVVPSDVTARIQEMHILIGQMLCGALEQDLGLI